VASNPGEFPQYEGITRDGLNKWLGTFKDYLENHAAERYGLSPERVAAHPGALFEIAERVEKQRIYCHIFHKREMGELNEMAVTCYWLLKLQPFYSVDNSLASYELNAKIVLFIFVEVLKFHATKTGGRLKLNNKGNQLDNLYYAFRYRNIGRAAMMHLAELSVT